MVASRHASVPEHSTSQGRSTGHVMVSSVHSGFPPPPHAMRHSPESPHGAQESSQPPGSGSDSPQASMSPVVPLEPSVLAPVDVPSAAVVPLVLATAVVEDGSPVVVAGGPELEDSLVVVIGSPPGPCPNSLGEQPKRHTTAIASPRTPRA